MGYDYLSYRSNNAVSDAAFVRSESLSIVNFKVAGEITLMSKKEGDSIKKGELLAKIDSKDFIIAKKRCK